MTLRQLVYYRMDIPTQSHPLVALPPIAKDQLTVFSLAWPYLHYSLVEDDACSRHF